MLRQFKPAIYIFIVLTLGVGVIYPAIGFVIGQTIFKNQANGSIAYMNKTPVGSYLLGQSFSGKIWFQPRPSAVGYEGNSSGASNLALTNPKLIQNIEQLANDYRRQNGLPKTTSVPADAVTTSGSGLDADISVANAELQAPRVAKARSISLALVQSMIDRATSTSPSFIFGTKVVNVVTLNLELKEMKLQ